MTPRTQVIAVVLACAAIWGWENLGSRGGGGSQYEKDCGAVFIEAAKRIDRDEITSHAEWKDFTETGRVEAAKRNHLWIHERMDRAVGDGKWDKRTCSDASLEIGGKLGAK